MDFLIGIIPSYSEKIICIIIKAINTIFIHKYIWKIFINLFKIIYKLMKKVPLIKPKSIIFDVLFNSINYNIFRFYIKMTYFIYED